MTRNEKARRRLLVGLAGLGIGRGLSQSQVRAEAAPARGYVLGPNQGEQLILRGGNIFIKTDPRTGSRNLAVGTQQVLKGVGIPIHRHWKMDEAFYVVEGSGNFILEDVRHPVEQGGSIFIPANAWHGFENQEHELVLLWMVAPTGLEAFFREVASPPGVAPTPRTKDQLNEIARRYETEFR